MARLRDDYLASLVAIVLMGLATSNNNGLWSKLSFGLVSAAFVTLVWRVARAAIDRGADTPRRPAIVDAAGPWIVLVLLASMPITAIFDTGLLPPHPMRVFTDRRLTLAMELVLLATYLPFLSGARVESERIRTLRFAVGCLVVLVAGVLVVSISTDPDIDVWTIQQHAAYFVLEGKNPYEHVAIPTTDLADNFTVVYNYPPISIYGGLVGYLFAGDCRFAWLYAIIVAGIALRIIARSGPTNERRPALLEDAPALAFLLWSPQLMIVDRAWIDPLQVALIALAVAAHVRKKDLLAAALLGLALTSKQSMFWLVPLAPLLLRFDMRRAVAFGAAALAPLVPFLYWNAAQLKYNLFDFMTARGNRSDALCFTAFVEHAFGARFPTQIAFVLAALAVLNAWRRRALEQKARDAEAALDFARALAFAYFLFFFFNRWMFANYYCTVAGFAAITAAAAASAPAPRVASRA